MDIVPNTGSAVIIIVAFLLPGFVTVLVQERTFRSADDPTELDRLLRIVWYSAWSYVLVAVAAIVLDVHRSDIVHLYHRYKGDPEELVWRAALVVLVPSVVIAEATRWWSKSRSRTTLLKLANVNERHSEPTAWDYFMRQGRGAYVRVTFADGSRVLGYYGARSFAAYAKDGRDLYLERTFVPDEQGWFGPEADGNCGVWVRAAEAISVEFYTPQDAAQETQPKRATLALAFAIAVAFTVAGRMGRTRRADSQSDAT
jgi:hypothetical protein